MSKWVRLNPDGTVREIVPTEVVELGIARCMGEEFAAQCVESPDEVQQNWRYDGTTFSQPETLPENQQTDIIAALAEFVVDHEYRLSLLELGVTV